MGLSCSVSLSDLGLPPETSVLGILIDYSEGLDIFQSVFLETAQSLCPVRTGYLQSSITADIIGDGVDCEAGAPYAQYVEYGTWKMGARPFFEPALQAAMSAASGAFQSAYEQAMQEEQEMLEAQMMDEFQAQMGGAEDGFGGGGQLDFSSLDAFISSFISLVIIGIIMGIIQEFFDLLFGDPDKRNSHMDDASDPSSFPLQITIF